MKKLNDNWITQAPMDAEYKRYLLLASLKNIREDFDQSLLFPNLSDLFSQYRSMNKLANAKNFMREKFPKTLSGIHPKLLGLEYNSDIAKADYETYLEDLLQFSLPEIEAIIKEGKDLYDWVDENLEIEPVGIMPVYQREGYLFLYPENSTSYHIYRFKMSRIQRMGEHFRSLKLTPMGSEKKSAFESFQNIKLQLIKRFQELPNPATFIAKAAHHLPVAETLLPVAKRRLMQSLEM